MVKVVNSYKGKTVEELQKIPVDELLTLLNSRQRRSIKRGLSDNKKKLIAEIYGKKSGCSGGIGGSMHLIDTSKGFIGSTAIVGNTIPIGAGISLSMSLKKNNRNLTYIFFS